MELLQRLAAKLEELMARSATPAADVFVAPPTPTRALSDQDIEDRFRVRLQASPTAGSHISARQASPHTRTPDPTLSLCR